MSTAVNRELYGRSTSLLDNSENVCEKMQVGNLLPRSRAYFVIDGRASRPIRSWIWKETWYVYDTGQVYVEGLNYYLGIHCPWPKLRSD